jgi:peptidoglycan/xylan/chitin deacetylase (PgdA/CDA1 family)
MSNYSIASAFGNILSPSGRRGRLAVFCFHQVLESYDAYRPGEPTVEEFASDVELIASFFNVLPFGEAATMLAENRLPKRAACITFDDGYSNNHTLAAPILEAAGVPATFFIAGGAIDAGVMWNDLVIEAIASRAGHVSAVSSELAELKYRPIEERWEIAEQRFGSEVGGDLPRLMMTRQMVHDLSRRGFEIGGHTINHPILKGLPDDEARNEIRACRNWIQSVTGSAASSFAYPNGRSGIDFDERHVQMVADAGFEAAASTDWNISTTKTSKYRVPRVGPWWRQGRSFESGLLRSYLRSYL